MTVALAAPLDSLCRIATPEGCEIELRVAGPVARARAWFLDFLLRLGLWLLLAMAAAQIGDFGTGLLLLGAFLLEWWYPIIFEVYRHGQTPGKKACALAVVHDDGRPVGWSAAFIRNTLRSVDILPLMYAAGFVTSLLNAEGKRLGDLAAGTLVVHVDETARRPVGAGSALGGEVGGEAPPFVLTREEQLAIIEYSQRAALLTPERAAELAAAAGPLSAGLDGEAARRRLLRIANFLLGSQVS
ncbi:RDD family protein [Candidatus Accumulibacter vicinus]|uniref:RDD family protein n=1 Tax=Candidatus Accumulibacter vicinus TaxID=2954382 RepID=A0A084Y030_9PROT|nr:RDD family protein [Candidatus Accumulibacter vicinus]KFB68074.1 MAG: RDD family protein [Candidatus Accumulibacter vicinus]